FKPLLRASDVARIAGASRSGLTGPFDQATPREGGAAPLRERTRAAISGTGFDTTNHRDFGALFSLQGEIPRFRACPVISGAVVDACGHDDLAARGGSLETRRGVDHVTDRGEVLDLARADIADVGSAKVKTDAELHPRLSIGVARGRQQRMCVGCHVLCRLA